MRPPFRFKQFSLSDSRSAMRLSTDAVLLGALTRLRDPATILDVGTGSGIVALILAQRCTARITGIDMDRGSIADAEENFLKSPWSDRLAARHRSLQDLSESPLQQFDLIVCNPPYFENSQRSPYPSRNLARHDDNLTATSLFAGIRHLLSPGGMVSVIVPAGREADFNHQAAGQGLLLQGRYLIKPKPGKDPNRVILEYGTDPRGTVESMLTIRKGDNSYTENYRSLTADFYLAF